MGYLKRRHREKARLMKQFTKLDGPCGNTQAYRDNWDRIFKGPEFEDVMEALSEAPEQVEQQVYVEVKRDAH
jgi:predicted nuclease with TOPRIM domain